MDKWIKISSWLMIVSAITHVLQLIFYHETETIIGMTVVSALYLTIGLGLRGPKRWAFWMGAILPTIGGAGGLYRLFIYQPNPFSAFHVLIDLVVVPTCIMALIKGFGKQ